MQSRVVRSKSLKATGARSVTTSKTRSTLTAEFLKTGRHGKFSVTSAEKMHFIPVKRRPGGPEPLVTGLVNMRDTRHCIRDRSLNRLCGRGWWEAAGWPESLLCGRGPDDGEESNANRSR